MFVLSNALKNIRRHGKRGLLYFLICAAAVLTLQVYVAGIDRTKAQLAQLAGASELNAQVVNMDASKDDDLQIRLPIVNGLLNSELIRGLNISVNLRAAATEEQRNSPEVRVVGVNRLEALDGLAEVEIDWLPDQGPDCLAGSKFVCVADRNFLASQGLSLGDILSLEVFRTTYGQTGSISYTTLGVRDFRIVGMTDTVSVKNAPSVLLPLTTAQIIHADAGEEFFASAASFGVQDPLGLNAFKKEMLGIGIAHVDFTGMSSLAVLANMGAALLMDDANFILSATRLRESLDLLNAFLPVIIVVLAVIGYFVAYLMVQSRADEYAVLRLLGLGKGRSVGMYFLEMAVLTLAGALVGLLLALVFGIVSSMGSALGIFALFVACFLLGSGIALWRLSRVNVMLALSRVD